MTTGFDDKYFRALIENSHEGIAVIGAEGETIYISPTMKSVLGYSEEEIAKDNCFQFVHPDYMPAAQKIFQDFVAGRIISQKIEVLTLHKNGNYIWIEATATNMLGNNSINGIVINFRDIDESKRTEIELIRSEKKFRQIYRNINVGIARVSLDFNIMNANDAYCRMLGYSEEELIGKHLKEITHPEILEENLKKQTDLGKGIIESYFMEKKFIHKGGHIIYGILNANLIRDEKGMPDYFIGSVVDITKRKEAEGALIESEKKFRNLFKYHSAVKLIIDPENGTIVEANKAAETFYGWRVEELEHMTIMDINILSTEEVMSQMKVVRESRKNHFEFKHRKASGTVVDVDVFTSMVSINGKEFLHSIIHDITEKKKVETELARSERKFRQIYNNIQVGLASISLDFTIMNANKAYCEMLGYSEKELIGKHLKEITHPETLEENLNKQNLLREGKMEYYFMEKKFIHKDGHTIPGIMTSNLIRNEDGSPDYFMGSVIDITEKKKIEEEKEKLQSQLVQSQKMESIGRLAGGVAHDFNNMLSVILGRAEIALQKTDYLSELYTELNEIKVAAERSAELTAQLLAFARKQVVSPKVVSLYKELEKVSGMLERLIGEDIRFVLRKSEEIKNIRIDPSQISQLLTNLCVNAKDAGAKTITVSTENVNLYKNDLLKEQDMNPGEYIVLSVKDDGSGMTEEIKNNIFEPFFTTKKVGEGTGLGLSTIYGIIKQNKGSIKVKSEVGKGSEFLIFFPSVKEVRNEEKIEIDNHEFIQSDKTILLVEDEESILEMTEIMLREFGYRVISAASPAEAINLALESQGKIDLLLTDVVMPEMNGRDLAKKIMSYHPDIKSVFMSGYTADVIASQGVLDEDMNFLHKPFTMKKLREKLEQVMRKRT